MGAGDDVVLGGRGRVRARCDRSRSRGWIRRAVTQLPEGGDRPMIAMFRAVLYTQWKWSRLIVVLGTVAAFAIPLLSLQGAARADRGALQTQELLGAVQSWGALYPLLATALGLLMAIAAWAARHLRPHHPGLQPAIQPWPYQIVT